MITTFKAHNCIKRPVAVEPQGLFFLFVCVLGGLVRQPTSQPLQVRNCPFGNGNGQLGAFHGDQLLQVKGI